MIDGKLKLLPGHGTDRIRLNAKIDSILEEFEIRPWSFEGSVYEDQNQTTCFENEEWGISIYDNDPEEIGIDMITCRVNLEYKGRNLIGMTIDGLEQHLGMRHDDDVDRIDFEDDPVDLVYEFDDLGIQVWTREDDNIVHTIIIGHIINDDDETVYLDDPQRVYDGYISEVPDPESN